VDDIPGAIKELEHARKLGLAGALRAAALSQRRGVPGRFQPGGGRRQCAESRHSSDRWREYDPEDTMRFYALHLHEAKLIKSNPTRS